MNFEGKKLLVLCGNVVHVKVVEEAKRMGIHTIVTDSLPIKDAPAKRIADEALYLNVLDIDGIVDYCTKNHVDGVINFCNDIAQRPHQQICERLGLPCYGTYEQYYMLTDKNSFKEACRKYGVDTIPQYSEKDIEAGTIEYPVLVKPVDSRGSRGQTICYSEKELDEALLTAKKESTNNHAIIEKYMAGKQDFTMTYVFKNGKGYLTRTADRYLGCADDGLSKQSICCVAPSKYTDLYIQNTDVRVRHMLRMEGITDAPVFMQGFIDENTVRFYDPGFRFPGAEYEKLLYEATGINLMREMISLALGGEISDYDGRLSEAYKLCGKVSVQLYVSACGGPIVRFDGLDEIAMHPNVVTVAQRYFVGDTVPRTGDVKQRICEIVILADRDSVKETVRWVQSKLVVEDKAGKNLLVSQFNPEILG